MEGDGRAGCGRWNAVNILMALQESGESVDDWR